MIYPIPECCQNCKKNRLFSKSDTWETWDCDRLNFCKEFKRWYKWESQTIQYPEVIKPRKRPSKKYLMGRALLHLRDHFSARELAILFKKSKKWIYKKLRELR